MVPRGQRRRVRKTLDVVAGYAAIRTEVDRACDGVALIIAADEDCLPVRQVEVEPADVGVQLRRRARVETKTTRVQAVADRRIVCGVALCCGCEHRERLR